MQSQILLLIPCVEQNSARTDAPMWQLTSRAARKQKNSWNCWRQGRRRSRLCVAARTRYVILLLEMWFCNQLETGSAVSCCDSFTGDRLEVGEKSNTFLLSIHANTART